MKKYISYISIYGASLLEEMQNRKLKISIGQSPEIATTPKGKLYLCPLCMTNFIHFFEDNFDCSEDFSLDHYPPESVGGKKKALVCQPCNSWYGREIDYAIKEHLQLKQFLAKQDKAAYPIKLKSSEAPGIYKMNTFWENGELVISLPAKKYPILFGSLFRPTQEMSFSLITSPPKQSVVGRAILKAAYLYCFNAWGYDFGLSRTADQLRRVIQGTLEHPLSNYGIFSPGMANQYVGLAFIHYPSEFNCFAVHFGVNLLGFEEKYFVIIPTTQDGSWEKQSNLENFSSAGELNVKSTTLASDSIHKHDYFAYTRHSFNLPRKP